MVSVDNDPEHEDQETPEVEQQQHPEPAKEKLRPVRLKLRRKMSLGDDWAIMHY